MLIRKTAGFFLAALLLAAAALGIFLPLPSRRADADTSPVSLTTENADLFLPESYEQYLALNEPTDVAVCDKYIAVADENSIYVFSRESGQYSVYTNGSSSSVKINKIQFSDSGDLYFVNSAMQFYKLNLVDMSVGKTPLYSLSNFFISGNLIYAATTTANETQLRILNLDGSDDVAEIVPLVDKLNATPHLFFENGILYYTIVDTVTAYTVATRESERFILKDNKSSTDLTPLTPSAICAYGDDIFFTNSRGLFRNNKSQNDLPPIDEDDDYSALTEYEGMLYAVKGKTIKQYDIEAGEFTDYEIAAASSSDNRLSGAGECVRAGNLLVTADKGNDRISVYDTATDKYQTIECEGVVHVATDGTSIAATTAHELYVYETSWNSGGVYNVVYSFDNISNYNIAGIINVHGTYYFATAGYQYGTISRSGEDWVCSDPKVRGENITPKAIAADLFGDIFVVDQSGNVYELGEDDFAATGGLGNPVATIQGEFTSLRAGFDGTLYYLDENGKFCGVDGEIANIDGADFVYLGEGSRQPVSFALGFEDDEVYFCFGEFIVKSKAGELGLATLESVSRDALNDSAETLSAVPEPDKVALADFEAGSVGIQVNLSALQDGGNFAAGYYRYDEKRRGVVLAKHGDYSLVALYEEHVYTVELFRTADASEEAPAPEIEQANGEMYLSSDCPAYHFPCIADLPAREEVPLPRGTRVRVVAYFGEGGQEEAQGGYTFAYVEYETAARSASKCYVPAAYLTEVDPLGDAGENYTLGYVKPGATFTDPDGNKIVTEERVQARLYQNEDGTYTARYEKEGVSYTANLEAGQIEWGESDAWRIALIVILSVVAVLIIGGYVFLLPWNKKQTK